MTEPTDAEIEAVMTALAVYLPKASAETQRETINIFATNLRAAAKAAIAAMREYERKILW